MLAMRGRGRRSRGRSRGAVGAARDGGAEQQEEEEEQQEPPRVYHRVTRFCPQCGGDVEPTFRFCPACGDRLPAPPPPRDAAGPPPPQAPSPAAAAGGERSAAVPVLSPPAARTPPRPPCPAARRGTPSPRKARPGPAEPLPEGEELRDRGAGRWRLRRLLEQGGCGLLYEGCAFADVVREEGKGVVLSLGHALAEQRQIAVFSTQDVKDSKIYNEQNFFQRAAKKDRVEKWKKLHSLPLLGIPSCLGFGLHADKYRFLVFSDLGRSLQSILSDNLHLNEKAAFQIAVRLLDCLEYLHDNEYVHGDITADNIYVNPADLTQVTLAGYYFAFRYCPEGKHVARREGSRTPHEGTIEFISQDSHRGAAPSRRSDLESLGYCLLKWLCGFLPWSKELDKVETVMEKKEMYKNDVTCLLQQCFSRQRSIPAALQSYLQQVMALEYEEKPNYEALRQLFKKPLQMLKASAYDSVDIMVVP